MKNYSTKSTTVILYSLNKRFTFPALEIMVLTFADVSKFSMTVETPILQSRWIQTGKDESTSHSPRVEQSSFYCDGHRIKQVSIALQQLWTRSRIKIDERTDITIFHHISQFTHQHVHIQHPTVLSRRDAEGSQINTESVVKHFIQDVAKLHPQVLSAPPLKLRGGIRWANEERICYLVDICQ